MANKKESLSVNLSKLILTVSIIVSLGALVGAVGYLASHPEQIIIPFINPVVTDFYSCSEDSDCLSVKGDCCGCTAGGIAAAINKKFKNQWKNNCNATEPIMCPAVMSDDPSCINKEPRCAGNKCVLKEKIAAYSSYDEVPDKYANGSYSVKGFINNAKNLDKAPLALKGKVNKKNECPVCPEGVPCAPCAPPHLFITDPVITGDDGYSVVINFGRDQDTVNRLKVGDIIEINAFYAINGDGVTVENVPGSLWFLSFFEEKIIANQDICDIGKGDWGNGNAFFAENNAYLNIARQKCEAKSDCGWEDKGGKIINHYVCCPKDLENIITNENRNLYERCFVIID